MVMKKLIRQILKEEKEVKVLKSFIFKIFQNQVSSGLTPHIPYEDLRRKKLTQYIELIDKWYFEFLESHYDVSDGFEKAKTLFHNTIEDINEEALKNVGIGTGQDRFEVSIPWIEFSGEIIQLDVEFGFKINDCYLETEDGMKTYEELLDDDFSDYEWIEVTDFLRSGVEEYVQRKGYDFGLNIFDVESEWAD
jgi:hypothetical protein